MTTPEYDEATFEARFWLSEHARLKHEAEEAWWNYKQAMDHRLRAMEVH